MLAERPPMLCMQINGKKIHRLVLILHRFYSRLYMHPQCAALSVRSKKDGEYSKRILFSSLKLRQSFTVSPTNPHARISPPLRSCTRTHTHTPASQSEFFLLPSLMHTYHCARKQKLPRPPPPGNSLPMRHQYLRGREGAPLFRGNSCSSTLFYDTSCFSLTHLHQSPLPCGQSAGQPERATPLRARASPCPHLQLSLLLSALSLATTSRIQDTPTLP